MSSVTMSPQTMADDAGIGLIDSYYVTSTDLQSVFNTAQEFLGQSFTNTSSSILGSASIYLKKVGSPTGNAYIKIYAHTGTYGTSSVPTGSALATSDAFDVSTLTTSSVLTNFTFSGANQITLSASTYYCAEINYSGGDSSNRIQALIKIGGSASGNLNFSATGSSFTSSSYDLLFYIYSVVGTIAWTDPDNAKVSDGVYAIASSIVYLATSHYLKATNFGFSIPIGATINGIIVEVMAIQDTTQGVPGKAILVKGGTFQGTVVNSGNFYSTTTTYSSFGSSGNLWGLSLTPTDINATDFGVGFYVYNNGYNLTKTISVDHIRTTIYYTETPSAVGPFPTFFQV